MELSKNAQQIMDLLKELSVTELNDLVKALEEEFGVSAAPVAVAWWWWASDEEWGWSDTVTVEIAEIWQQKITVIKTLKEALGLGLKEAKELVEKVPGPVKENVSPDEWEELKAKLEEAGATVTLK